jgi:hypothetical protein
MFSSLHLAQAPTSASPSTPSQFSQANVITRDTRPKVERHESWEMVSTPSTPPHSSPLQSSTPRQSSPISDFDTETFPSHSRLFPSSPNGTWRDEAKHAIKHPSTIDIAELHAKLCALTETASDELSARINMACEGKDVPAIHDKVMNMLPSVKIPDRREVDRLVDELCDRVQEWVNWIRCDRR